MSRLELAAENPCLSLPTASSLNAWSCILSMTSVLAIFEAVRTSGKSARRRAELVGHEGAPDELDDAAGLAEVGLVVGGADDAVLALVPAGGAVAAVGRVEVAPVTAVAGGTVALGDLVAPALPTPFNAAILEAAPRATKLFPSCRRRPAHMQCRGGRVVLLNLKMRKSREKSTTISPASPRRNWGPEDAHRLAELRGGSLAPASAPRAG